jgi:hypothetical protein
MKSSLALLISISILIVLTTQCSHPEAPRQVTQAKLEPEPTSTSTSAPTPTSTPTSAQVVLSTKELARLADSLEIKATMKDRINSPKFFINSDTFVFYEGSLPNLGDDAIQPKQYPILIPLARKLQLDDLRRFLSEQPERDIGYWDKSFQLADAIIEQKSLALIASGTMSGDELTAKLYEYDGSISKLFDDAAKAFAESRNLKFAKAGIVLPMTHTVQVTFIKNPDEGHLFIIPSTLYAPDGSLDYMWREILDEKPRLGGTYYYKVVWPDGAQIPPTLLKVETDGQVFTINR